MVGELTRTAESLQRELEVGELEEELETLAPSGCLNSRLSHPHAVFH